MKISIDKANPELVDMRMPDEMDKDMIKCIEYIQHRVANTKCTCPKGLNDECERFDFIEVELYFVSRNERCEHCLGKSIMSGLLEKIQRWEEKFPGTIKSIGPSLFGKGEEE
jgi:hypothetical protein